MRIKRLNLIGYIRTGGSEFSAKEQKLMLREYCELRNLRITKYFDSDTDCPSFGFNAALEALDEADGIIAVDLARLAQHKVDAMIELRPVLEKLMHAGKVIITVLDGIDTFTLPGQKVLMDMMHSWNDRERMQRGPMLQVGSNEQSVTSQ